MNEQFTWHRLGLLIRNDIVGGYRPILCTFAVLAIIMMLSAIPSVGFGHIDHGFYFDWFVGMLCIWGSIAASFTFHGLHDKTKNESYLLLPASALEKTIARILKISVIFVTYLLLFTTLISLVTEGINLLAFGRYNSLFNPFDQEVWICIGTFLVVQSMFFLGAAWFRTLHWFKTVLSVSVIGIGLGVLTLVAFRILFADFFIGLVVPSPGFFVAMANIYSSNKDLWDTVWMVLKVLYFSVLAPFCWFVAWLRVKETQVSHGI